MGDGFFHPTLEIEGGRGEHRVDFVADFAFQVVSSPSIRRFCVSDDRFDRGPSLKTPADRLFLRLCPGFAVVRRLNFRRTDHSRLVTSVNERFLRPHARQSFLLFDHFHQSLVVVRISLETHRRKNYVRFLRDRE